MTKPAATELPNLEARTTTLLHIFKARKQTYINQEVVIILQALTLKETKT